MRVLITGATGFVGKKLVARLVDLGHQVVVLSRSPEQAAKKMAPPCRFFAWDGKSEVPAEAWEGVDAVVHLAGESVAGRWTAEKKKKIRDSRVLSTRALVRGIEKLAQPPRAFLCASATGYYGDTQDAIVNETSPPGSDFLAEVCVQWEAEARKLTAARTVFLRTGLVLGHGGGLLAPMLPVFEWGLGGRIGSGQQWMSWIHLDDLVSMYLWALESAQVKGAVNAVAPAPVRNAEFVKALGHALHKPAVLPAPAFALRLALGEFAQAALGGTRVEPRQAMALGFPFQFPTLSRALHDLFDQGNVQVLEREQFIPLPVEEVFPFFSDAKNLETLTPPWMGFQVLKASTEEMAEGTLIDYKLKVHGVPMRWRTRIEQWSPGRGFVDTQLKGPYRYWHHTHTFIPVEGGTLMRDRVKYRLPAGGLGKLIAGSFVANDVRTIFDYRWKKVDELFCRKPV